jgi:hypothetical protein
MIPVKAVKRLGLGARRVPRSPDATHDPEPLYATARPMTGFFSGLSPDQKATALAYRGPENHGQAEPPKKRL